MRRAALVAAAGAAVVAGAVAGCGGTSAADASADSASMGDGSIGSASVDSAAARRAGRRPGAPAPRRGMPERYTLPAGASSAGGIAYEPFTGQIYVSGLADGTVFRAHVKDTVLVPFLPGGSDGRVAAAGLAVDQSGHLLVAGDTTGRLFVYDADSGTLLRRLDVSRAGGPPPRLAGIAVTYGDVAYVTDAARGVIYRVRADSAGAGSPLRPWLDLGAAVGRAGAASDFRAIDATPSGAYLVVADGAAGKLYRVDTRTRAATEIALAGDSVSGAEGLLLVESTVYVIRRMAPQLLKVQLASDLTAGVVTDTLTISTLAAPMALAEAGSRLLVVDSPAAPEAGDARRPASFTVSSVPTP
jgi:Cu-Zn family superoxide dismutase